MREESDFLNLLCVQVRDPTRFCDTLFLPLCLLDLRFDLGIILGLSLSFSDLEFALVNIASKVSKVVL